MNYYDEGRPRISYRPAYVDNRGRAIAPLPSLSVLPLLQGGYRLGVWLRTSFNSAREFHAEVSNASELVQLLTDFMLEPESVLHEAFGYSGIAGTSSSIVEPAKQTLRLSDIGL
jgi:hypothetical protein